MSLEACNSACLSDVPVICLARALNRQFPSPKTLSTFLLVRDRNGSIKGYPLLGLSDMLVVAGRSGRLIAGVPGRAIMDGFGLQ